MSYIGLDIGLTGCKACLFEEASGRLLAGAYREYRMESPLPGRHELNPAVVWRNIKECLSGISQAAAGDPPAALSISSHGESAVPVGHDGKDLANAIAPFDQRIPDMGELWGNGLGMEEMARITGQPPHQMYTLPRMLWYRKHRPEVYGKAWKFLCFQEYALYRLGAEVPVTSYSQAARTWAFDVHRKAWADEVLAPHGLRAELFAKAAPAATVVGEMDRRVAQEVGLPYGTKLVTGGHDQPCGALGAGVLFPGVAADSTGTVECITPAFEKPLTPEVVLRFNLCNEPHVVDGLYVTLAYNITGGSVLKWYRDRLGHCESEAMAARGLDYYAEKLKDLPPGPSGLLVLPHFSGSGTPWCWNDSRGAILGLDLETDEKRLLKGILEGLAFEMQYNLRIMEREGLSIGRFICVGGGAKSDAWLQIKADIFGRPVLRTDVTEGACLGCAMMCAHAVAGASYGRLAEDWVRTVGIWEPEKEQAARYREYFELYSRMQETLRPVQQELHRLRSYAL